MNENKVRCCKASIGTLCSVSRLVTNMFKSDDVTLRRNLAAARSRENQSSEGATALTLAKKR